MTGRYLHADDERKIIEVAEARRRKRVTDAAQRDAGNTSSEDKNGR
jgi:hypothetical protein